MNIEEEKNKRSETNDFCKKDIEEEKKITETTDFVQPKLLYSCVMLTVCPKNSVI